METATFAGGCFWCLEAVFTRLKGVERVQSGYTDGHIKNPCYREVCSGKTGHAEAVQMSFNPDQVSFDQLLAVFFSTHDPTTLNRQGADIGTQYRSAIFYHSEVQKQCAEKFVEKLTIDQVFKVPIVTVISPATIFYLAEEAHQNYYDREFDQPYCNFVIAPKIQKLKELFSGLLKESIPPTI